LVDISGLDANSSGIYEITAPTSTIDFSYLAPSSYKLKLTDSTTTIVDLDSFSTLDSGGTGLFSVVLNADTSTQYEVKAEVYLSDSTTKIYTKT